MSAISKPLIPSKETKLAAAQFHRAVFALFGYVCWLHRCKDPRSKYPATDAAHVIKASRLGAKHAYASVRFARPLCREDHTIQELGLDPMFRFPWLDVIDVITTYNALDGVHAKLPIPEPWVDAWKTT